MKITKVLKGIIIVCVLLLAGIAVASGLYLRQQSKKDTFFRNTTINGYDVSEIRPADILPQLIQDYTSPKVSITENGEEQLSGSLADFGYVLDEKGLEDSLNKAWEQQRNSIPALIDSLMNGNHFRVLTEFAYDDDVFRQKVRSANLKDPRIVSVDSEMLFDEPAKNYYLTEEVFGTEFADEDLQALLKEKLDELTSQKDPQADLVMEIPEEIYVKPQVTSDDVELNNLCNIYNRYDKAKITHTFGEEKRTIDWNTIQNWLIIENGEGHLDEVAIYEYVEGLAYDYNTYCYDRTFQTSLGNTIYIDGSLNEYGYLINEDEEFSQLLADIHANTETTREPIYLYAGYHRNGRDDLAGTYVEVNLSMQHLWFYKDGGLVVESDLVSGNVAKNTTTQIGVFPLAYKESPSVLVGDDAEDGYRTEVAFWMPFFEGQGLHDATWRSAFGGNIYQTSGSHGCVNLPYGAAQTIYNNIDAGVAIIVYQ